MSSSSSLLFLPWCLADVWSSACGKWMHSHLLLFVLQVFHRWFAPPAGQLCGQTSWPYAPTHDIQTCRSGENSTDHAPAEYLPAPPPSRAGQGLYHSPSGEVWPDRQSCSPWWSFIFGAAGLGPSDWLPHAYLLDKETGKDHVLLPRDDLALESSYFLLIYRSTKPQPLSLSQRASQTTLCGLHLGWWWPWMLTQPWNMCKILRALWRSRSVSVWSPQSFCTDFGLKHLTLAPFSSLPEGWKLGEEKRWVFLEKSWAWTPALLLSVVWCKLP